MSAPVSCHYLVVERLQRDGEVGRAPVFGDEDGGVGVVVAGDRLDVGAPAHAALERLDPRPRRRRGDRGVLDDRQHGRDPQAGVVQAFPRFDRLGRRVVGAVGVEAAGDPAAEGAGEEEEEDREEADSAGVAVGEAGEGVEHQLLLSRGAGSRRRCLHPLAPVGEPLVELDPPLQHHQRVGVVLLQLFLRLRLHRAQPRGDAAAVLAHRAQRLGGLLGRQHAGEEQFQQPFFAHLHRLRRLAQPVLQLALAVVGDRVDGPLALAAGGVAALDQARPRRAVSARDRSARSWPPRRSAWCCRPGP